MNGITDPLRLTATICAAAALLAVGAGAASGHWRGGAGVAIGLLVGAANGFLARRALGIEMTDDPEANGVGDAFEHGVYPRRVSK